MPEPEIDALIRSLQQTNRRWKSLSLACLSALVLVLMLAAWIFLVQQHRLGVERLQASQALHAAQEQRDIAEQARQQAEEARKGEENARQEAATALKEEQQAKGQARRLLYAMQINLAAQQWQQQAAKDAE